MEMTENEFRHYQSHMNSHVKSVTIEEARECVGELFKVVGWLIFNKLSLNIKKTNYIIFHPYQKRVNLNICIKAYDSRTKTFFDLERKDHVKYLG